jgi:hypothetical protein
MLPAGHGAIVVIRADGQVVGRGQVWRDEADGVVFAGALASAVDGAMAWSAARGPLPDGARHPLESAVISIELAGAPIPTRAATLAELSAEISPGLHGVGVRGPDGSVRAAFPSWLRTRDQDAASAVGPLAGELAGSVELGVASFDELRAAGMELFRFRTTEVVQPGPGEPGVLTVRGVRPVSDAEINAGTLRAMAAELSAHLAARAWTGPEAFGLSGPSDPTRGSPTAAFAAPAEQALTALALARFARTGSAGDAGVRGRAASAASWVLARLAQVEPGEDEPWADAVSAAACVAALGELPAAAVERSGDLRTLRERCVPVVRGAFDADGTRAFQASVPEAAGGLVALAHARLAAWGMVEPDAARSCLSAAVERGGAAGLAAQQPWITLGALAHEGTPGLELLRAGVQRLWSLQLRREQLGPEDADLAGGVALALPTGTPLPTWQMLRPLAGAAALLGVEQSAEEAAHDTVRLAAGLRFVRQLQADRCVASTYARPWAAVGGVRSAAWTRDQPLAASALGLLAVTLTLDGLERAAQAGQPGENTRE